MWWWPARMRREVSSHEPHPPAGHACLLDSPCACTCAAALAAGLQTQIAPCIPCIAFSQTAALLLCLSTRLPPLLPLPACPPAEDMDVPLVSIKFR